MSITAEVVNYATDPSIEVQTKAFLKALNSGDGKPMETMTPQEARQVLVGAQKSVSVDLSGIDVMEKTITQDGLSVKLYVVRPAGVEEELPAFMFFHGGGWVLGDFPTHQRLVRDLVVHSGMAAVFVEYTPSPEAKYPVAVTEAYVATKWVAENGADINVNGKKLAVVGNSVAGNMAAVVALMCKEKKGPELQFQVLFWPVTDANFDSDSYHQFANDRFLTRNMMIWFWDNYTASDTHREDIFVSPLRASLDQLKGLPPALVQTAENDVLRDQGEAYARKMNQAGVPVSLIRCQGMIHDYGMLNPLSHIPEVQSLIRYAAEEIKNALK
jgi:acetyl esterase